MPTTITGSGTINGLVLPTDSLKSGMVLIAEQSFSGVSSVSVNNCFTSAYENYRIIYAGNGSVAGCADTYMRLRASGTDYSGGSHNVLFSAYSTNTSGPARGWVGGATSLTIGTTGDLSNGSMSATDVMRPALATYTVTLSQYFATGASATYGGNIESLMWYAAAYDGFTIFPYSGTLTGTVRIYGYRNSL